MQYNKNMPLSLIGLLLTLTACDGQIQAIREYDCNAARNNCPSGFSCEPDDNGRYLCIGLAGAESRDPNLNSTETATRTNSPSEALCQNGASQDVLLLSSENDLVRFNFESRHIDILPPFDCNHLLPTEPAWFFPHSMAVDRNGIAWINLISFKDSMGVVVKVTWRRVTAS